VFGFDGLFYQEGRALAKTKKSLTEAAEGVNHSGVASKGSKLDQAKTLVVGEELVVHEPDFLFGQVCVCVWGGGGRIGGG